MRAECVQAVQLAAQRVGRTLTAADLRGIESKIADARKQLARKDINAYRQMTIEQQLAKAGDMVVQDAVSAAIKKRQREELTIIKRAEMQSVLDQMVAGGIDEMDALRRYTAFTADGKGGVQSFESVTNGLTSSYLARIPAFFQLMQESSFAGIQTSVKGMSDFIKESFGVDSQNPTAKKAWAEVESMRKAMLDHFNRLGGDIAPLANYRNPQALYSYSVARRGGRNGEVFVADMMQWVDRDAYVNTDGTPMTDAQLKDFLKQAFITLKTDGANKAPGEGGGAGMIANRNKAHRQIHYKSPDAYMAAMDKYGAGTVFDQVRSHVESMATDIALVDKFGPNAILEFNKAYSDAVGKTARKDTMLLDAFKVMSGQRGVANPAIAHWFGEARAALVASRLGSMLISQLADAGTAQAVTRSLNIPTSELMKWVGAMASDGQAREMARLHGLGLESALNSISRFAQDASTMGFFGKAASVVPTIQGANLWTQTWRQAFGVMLEAKLGDMTTKYADWSALPELDRNIFESLGVTDKDFAIWKLAVPTDYKGSKILGPDAIERIPTADIIKAIPDRIQRIMDQGASLIQRMTDQTSKERGWVDNREQKLNDYKTKIQKLMDEFEQTREKRMEDMSARSLQRAGELMMRVEKAELDMELAKKSIEALNEQRADRFMEEVQRGMEWYGRRRSEIGERLGAQRHSAKLAEAKLDRSYTAESERLITQANKLFGPERQEDGLVAIGKVTEAQKAFDAYAAKMEARIAKATKKDGTPKAGKEGTINRAELLSEQARIELEAIKQKANEAMDALRRSVGDNQKELSGLIEAVEGKRQRAETEADIASYLETEKSRDKIQGLLDTLEFRFNQTGDRAMSEGERLGYRKAMAEARIRQMDTRVKEAERIAGKEMFAKASDFEKRIDKRMAELDEFTKSVEARADERQKLIDEWNSSIGRKIEREAQVARQEAAQRLVTFTVEQSHQAVLQPSALSQAALRGSGERGTLQSEIVSLLTQFKSFPIAFTRQMLMERANFQAAGYNPWVFRTKLLATTTVLGGLALVLNDVVSGKDPRQIWDSNDPKVAAQFGLQALVKGGGIGIFGDIIEQGIRGFERPADVASGVVGPVAGYVLKDLFPTLLTGASALVTQDEKEIEKFTKHAYDSVKGITPGQNLWFIKGFLHNVLLDDLQEAANPGYKDRAKKRAMENYGQQYWMGMGEETRAPEFGNIVAQ